MYELEEQDRMCLSPAFYEAVLRSKNRQFRLSRSFSMGELVATSKRVDNWPTSSAEIFHLHNLCRFLLQPIRDHYGKSVRVSSGYRSPKLNTLVGGSARSQHSKGQAADFEVSGNDNRAVAKWIYTNLQFDQLILEFYKSSQGIHSGWVHCSYKVSGNRRQLLTAQKDGKKTVYRGATPASLDAL